jgi:hypothetical protein
VTGLLIAAVALTGAWDLKAPAEKDWSQVLKFSVDVSDGAQDHKATFIETRTLLDKEEAGAKMTVKWAGLEVNGNGIEEPPAWKLRMNKDGAFHEGLENLEADYLRMLAPLTFVYPNKSVSAGDKWESTVGKLTYSFEAKEEEKVGNQDTLKVAAKVKEKDGDLDSSGTWWIRSNGKVERFEVSVKGWLVPMAGPQLMEARISGKAAS